jgi:hypothetical protein
MVIHLVLTRACEEHDERGWPDDVPQARARRFQVHRGRAYALPARCAGWGGYTLHGGVTVGGRDAGGRECECRYLARPALARARLEETPAGLIRVTFKRPWADGTAGVTFTSLEFVERLAALVPPPRAHLVQTHGVLAAALHGGGRLFQFRLRPHRGGQRCRTRRNPVGLPRT